MTRAAVGTRSKRNSQKNAFEGQSATNALNHGVHCVRSAQMPATHRSWNGIMRKAFAVLAVPPPSQVSRAKSATAPGGYSECGYSPCRSASP